MKISEKTVKVADLLVELMDELNAAADDAKFAEIESKTTLLLMRVADFVDYWKVDKENAMRESEMRQGI